MDPISALNVAAATLQFLDFTGKVAAGTYQVYKRGSAHTTRHGDIKTLTTSLTELNDELQVSLATQEMVQKPTRLDKDLAELGKKCNEVGQRLINALERLQIQDKQTIWSSFGIALRSIWNDGDIDSLFKDLADYRAQMAMHILVAMRFTILSKSEKHQQSLNATQQLCEETLLKVDEHSRWQGDLIAAIKRNHEKGSGPFLDGTQSIDVNQYLLEKDVKHLNGLVLQRLRFHDIDRRYKQIVSAHTQTFDWLFQDPGLPPKWTDFLYWVRNDTSFLYWITGKPGAGKSTLMKYTFDHQATQSALRKWATAGNKPLITASFFFWNSGSEIQMSCDGLLRSLMFQIVSAVPDCIPTVFSHCVEACLLFGDRSLRRDFGEWTWDELLTCFRNLIAMISTTYRIAFFIDGMDEFMGKPTYLIDLINTLDLPNIKVCASSRPWVQFEDAFGSRPHLRLEHLTYNDIENYVTSKLNEHAAFDTYQRVNANLASQLITNTCEKASGVFLWVTLVTMSLLEGLTEGENFTELQERLDSLPTDLEELFKKLLFSLEEQHLRRASQYLQIRRAYPFRMTLLDLCVADSDDAELALKPLGNDFQGDKGAANCELMCRRLNASCKGLLDLTKYPSKALEGQEVDYLHRTVKDYLWRTEIWKKICATTPDTFDLSLRLYNVIMAQVQVGLQKRGDNSSSAKITEMVKLARNARTNEPNWNNRLLDAADASLALRYQSDLSMLTWGQLTMCTDNFLDAVTADQTEALATEQLVSALRKYETFTAYPLEVKLQLQARNARLIEVLFRHEANPYFCWDRVLRREFPGVGIDLIMMFLNNGADARNDLLKDWLRNDKDGALTAFMKKKKKESSVWRYFRK